MCREAPARLRQAALAARRADLPRLFARSLGCGGDAPRPDMLVVEGAMGLYDGGGAGGGCTAQLAALLGLPVLLILNAHGWGSPSPLWPRVSCAIARPGPPFAGDPLLQGWSAPMWAASGMAISCAKLSLLWKKR